MLVSAVVDAGLREEVEAGHRPLPDFLKLERELGVELLDWSRLGVTAGGRSWNRSARQVRVAWPLLDHYEAVFSDGEHLGIPLALALRGFRRGPAHVSIAHHLLTPAKRPFFRLLQAQKGTQALVVHSSAQKERYERELAIDSRLLSVVPYGVDTRFWHPSIGAGDNVVLSPGREQRDHRTLAAACAGLDTDVIVTAGSAHSPASRLHSPDHWPANLSFTGADGDETFDFIDRPFIRNPDGTIDHKPGFPGAAITFAAGITTVLEGMAMGKAVVASATAAIAEVIEDGVTGRLVAPGDQRELRAAVQGLLADHRERLRLGANAREACQAEFSLDRFAERLGGVFKNAHVARR